MAPIQSLQARYIYYYTTDNGLSSGAITGIALTSSLLFILSIVLCVVRARRRNTRFQQATANGHPYQMPTGQELGKGTYAYRTTDGQPVVRQAGVVPIYSTLSGNPTHPQTGQKNTTGDGVIAEVPPVYSGPGTFYSPPQQQNNGVIR